MAQGKSSGKGIGFTVALTADLTRLTRCSERETKANRITIVRLPDSQEITSHALTWESIGVKVKAL